MIKKESKHRHYSKDFKLSLLQEYYKLGCSKYSLCKRYGLNYDLFCRWQKEFESKVLSLPSELSELETQVYMSKKKSSSAPVAHEMSEEEKLREEVSRLRKALSYSELRNEALHEVLKIGREKYGLDLLKKAGAKQ